MNAYSILHNFDQPVYTPDFQFVSMALGYKQQKLDVNRQKIQSLYDHFSNLDVSKDIHKEYIDGRLKQILDINRNYHSMDLSDDNFASVVAGNVTQLMDDIVKGAVMDTRMIRAEDKEWEDQRLNFDPKKGGGKYNELNREYALAMSDRGAYQQDKELGRRYRGGAGFIAFADYNDKWIKNRDFIAEKLKATWVQDGGAAGHFRYQDTMEAVEPEKVREELSRIFTSDELRQMNIDGWGQYRSLGQDYFKQDWDNHIESKIFQNSKSLEYYNTLLATQSLTEEEKQQIKQGINGINEQIESLNNMRFDKISQTADINALYGKLYQEKFFDNIVNTYSYGPRVVKRDIDKVHEANVNFNQKLREFSFEQEKWVADQIYKGDKLKLDALKEGYEIDADGNFVPIGTDQSTPFSQAGVFQTVFNTMLLAEQDPFNALMLETNKAFATIQGLKGQGQNFTTSQVQDLVSQFNQDNYVFVDGKGFKFNVSGKDYYLDEQQLVQLQNSADIIGKENPITKGYYKDLSRTITQVSYDLGTLVQKGARDIGGMIPELGIAVEDRNGVLNVTKRKDAKVYYAGLLAKRQRGEKLSKAEQATVDLYTSIGIYTDSGFEYNDRLGVYNYVRATLSPNIKTNGLLPSLSKKPFVKEGKDERMWVEKAVGSLVEGIFGLEVNTSLPSANTTGTSGLFSNIDHRHSYYAGVQGPINLSSKSTGSYSGRIQEMLRINRGALEDATLDFKAERDYVTTITPKAPLFKTATPLLQENITGVYNKEAPISIMSLPNGKVLLYQTGGKDPIGLGKGILSPEQQKEFEELAPNMSSYRVLDREKAVEYGLLQNKIDNNPRYIAENGYAATHNIRQNTKINNIDIIKEQGYWRVDENIKDLLQEYKATEAKTSEVMQFYRDVVAGNYLYKLTPLVNEATRRQEYYRTLVDKEGNIISTNPESLGVSTSPDRILRLKTSDFIGDVQALILYGANSIIQK